MKFMIVSILMAFAQLSCGKSLSPKLMRWNESEGIQRLERSKHKVDFFQLANHFLGQPNGVVCGPTTGAIVLNALRLGKNNKSLPKTQFASQFKKHLPSKWDPRFDRYTPENFLGKATNKIKTWKQVYGEPIKGKKDYGLQLRQLHKIFQAHGVKSTLRVVTDQLKSSIIKNEIIQNLKTRDDYVVINYARKSLGQKGGGHISPIGAYDTQSDSFLILDVNPNKDHWVWVKSQDLISAMKTFDTIENRGYLLIKEK